MCTEEDFRRSFEAFGVHRKVQPPGKSFTQRVADRINEQTVSICPRERIEAGMKICAHNFCFFHGKVGGEFGIKSQQQLLRRMRPIIEIERRHLSHRMDTGVSPPCKENGTSCPSEFAKRIFQFALHGSDVRLPLASGKPGAVVG